MVMWHLHVGMVLWHLRVLCELWHLGMMSRSRIGRMVLWHLGMVWWDLGMVLRSRNGIVRYNKRPMGHIAHLRKQFKSINTYDYIITLIKRRKKKLLISWEFIGSSFEQTWIPLTPGCFVPSWVEIGPVVLEKKIFKFCQFIFATS